MGPAVPIIQFLSVKAVFLGICLHDWLTTSGVGRRAESSVSTQPVESYMARRSESESTCDNKEAQAGGHDAGAKLLVGSCYLLEPAACQDVPFLTLRTSLGADSAVASSLEFLSLIKG